jgi:hypothetical protein
MRRPPRALRAAGDVPAPSSLPGNPKTRDRSPAGSSTDPHDRDRDAKLAAAIAALKSGPSAASLKAVAAEYMRLGVFDQAIDSLTRALALAPCGRDAVRDARTRRGATGINRTPVLATRTAPPIWRRDRPTPSTRSAPYSSR